VPPLPTPLVVVNRISRADVLAGTAGRGAIRGFDGNTTLTGGGGNDAYDFGTDSRCGRPAVDTIRNYQAGQVVVALKCGTTVCSIVANGAANVITLNGDGKFIMVSGGCAYGG